MCGQDVGKDIFKPLQVKGAVGFKELHGFGLIKDFGANTITGEVGDVLK